MSAALSWKLLDLATTVGAAWLLTYAVHSTVLIAVVWAAARGGLLRSLRARDLAWRTALVGGLFTATLQLVAGLQPWGGSTGLRTSAVPDAAAVAQALREQGAPEGSAPAPAVRSTVRKVQREVAAPAELRTSVEEAPTAVPASPAPVVVVNRNPPRWMPVAPVGLRAASLAFMGWAVVASALLLRLALLRARVLTALGKRTPVVDPLVQARLLGLCRDVGHTRDVRLTTASGLRSPVALGWSEICLPAQALVELDAAQQRSVLAHELAHLRRLDPLWLVLGSVLEQVFFFQPLNHLARARMQEVAEYLCDDWAAARDGSGLSVAQGLASVAAWLDGRDSSIVPLAGMAEHPSQLLTRVQRLLQRGAGEVERLRAWHVFAAALLLVVTVLAAPGVHAAPEQSLLAARKAQPRPGMLTADAGSGSEPLSSRSMLAVQAIDTSLLESSSAMSSGDAPAAREAPAPAPAPARERATERKRGAEPQDSGTARPPARDEPTPAPHSAHTRDIPAATPATTREAASIVAVATPEVMFPASGSTPRIVLATSSGSSARFLPILASASVPPVPPVPPVAPVPPTPGFATGDFERLQRDSQRIAQDAQRRAQAAMRRAEAQRRGRHGRRAPERTAADPKTVDALISALKDGDPGVRQAAAESLGRIGDPRSIDPLGGLMGDGTIDVRRAAVEALGNIDDPRVIPSLSKATADASPTVRREAAEALLGLDDEAATPPLVKLLSDSDPRVRVTALEGLSRRGDRRALEPLGKLVKDPSVEVRSGAVRALARFKDPASQSALVTALKDENAEVRAAAAEALGELELKSAPQGLLDATRDSSADVRQAVAEALGQIHDAKAVPQLKTLLDDASAEVRSAAVDALSEIRDSSALQALITAMQSKDVTVRRAAAQALGQRE